MSHQASRVCSQGLNRGEVLCLTTCMPSRSSGVTYSARAKRPPQISTKTWLVCWGHLGHPVMLAAAAAKAAVQLLSKLTGQPCYDMIYCARHKFGVNAHVHKVPLSMKQSRKTSSEWMCSCIVLVLCCTLHSAVHAQCLQVTSMQFLTCVAHITPSHACFVIAHTLYNL